MPKKSDKNQLELFSEDTNKMTIEEYAKKHKVSTDKAFKLFKKCFPSRKRKYGQTLEIDSDDEKAMLYVYGTESHKIKYSDPTIRNVHKKKIDDFYDDDWESVFPKCLEDDDDDDF